MTKNRADEPQNSPQEPTSSQSGTPVPLDELRAQNDQMLDNIIKTLDECNKTIREINKGLSELSVMACAVTGFRQALDNFYAGGGSHE